MVIVINSQKAEYLIKSKYVMSNFHEKQNSIKTATRTQQNNKIYIYVRIGMVLSNIFKAERDKNSN